MMMPTLCSVKALPLISNLPLIQRGWTQYPFHRPIVFNNTINPKTSPFRSRIYRYYAGSSRRAGPAPIVDLVRYCLLEQTYRCSCRGQRACPTMMLFISKLNSISIPALDQEAIANILLVFFHIFLFVPNLFNRHLSCDTRTSWARLFLLLRASMTWQSQKARLKMHGPLLEKQLLISGVSLKLLSYTRSIH